MELIGNEWGRPGLFVVPADDYEMLTNFTNIHKERIFTGKQEIFQRLRNVV
jgi:hypothetical protein